MKRLIQQISKVIIILSLCVMGLSSCSMEGDEEIFENAELEMEQLTDDEKDVKSEPE